METWDIIDGLFDIPAFYYAIVELFEDPEDEWAKETLEWWNQYVVLYVYTSLLH